MTATVGLSRDSVGRYRRVCPWLRCTASVSSAMSRCMCPARAWHNRGSSRLAPDSDDVETGRSKHFAARMARLSARRLQAIEVLPTKHVPLNSLLACSGHCAASKGARDKKLVTIRSSATVASPVSSNPVWTVSCESNEPLPYHGQSHASSVIFMLGNSEDAGAAKPGCCPL